MNRLFLMLAVGLLAVVASATDRFVSTDAKWIMPGMTGTKYSNLQSAVTAAQAGETVWVQDGFLKDATSPSTTSYATYGKSCILFPARKIILRSESGYVDEANGKGAIIRGKDHSTTTRLGTNAVRPARVQTAGTVIMGFILENGSTPNANSQKGTCGAVFGPAIVSNCVIRNCIAYKGGAFGNDSVVAHNCTITNCRAEGNNLGEGGGAVYGGASLYNCYVTNNVAVGTGGAVYYDNAAGGVVPVYSNCVFSGNSAVVSGCADFSKDGVRATFFDCTITDNEAKDGMIGVTSTKGTAGGVRGMATFTRCQIVGNRASGDIGAVGAASATSGASPVLWNCVVSNNVAGGKCAALYLPGGGTSYNCLIVGNTSATNAVVEGNASSRPVFYNCTLADNKTTDGVGTCVSGVSFANSIVWGNAPATNETVSCIAKYTCQKDLNPRYDNNVTNNPALSPVYYRPTTRSACVDAAEKYNWMSAEVSDSIIRTVDVLGYPRIRGPKPDMGSCEREAPGSLVIGR